jgi:hypothetical protein
LINVVDKTVDDSRTRLLIVIVCYRVADLTINCLRALAPEVRALPGVRAVVCENGTGPESVDRLSSAIKQEGWSDWVDLVAVSPNRGFTGGNNVVIAPALESENSPDYFLLLNSDTIVQPNALGALIGFMESEPEVGIAGSRLESPNGEIQQNSFRFETAATEFNRGLRLGLFSRFLSRWRPPPPQLPTRCRTEWVSGASMIVRREVFEKIGLLDEGFYTYFDDIDLCLRATSAGFQTWYEPGSRVIHLDGRSTGICRADDPTPNRRPEYWFMARRRFFLKHYGRLHAALADAAFIVGFTLWRIRRAIQRKPDRDPPKMLWDSVKNSVFVTGWRLKTVENPAMQTSGAEPAMWVVE